MVKSKAERPVIVQVDGDQEAGAKTASALVRWFSDDYSVLTAGSSEEGVTRLAGLAEQGREVQVEP